MSLRIRICPTMAGEETAFPSGSCINEVTPSGRSSDLFAYVDVPDCCAGFEAEV